MKKLLWTLPLVAGVSWAGTTYYSGAQTQPAYQRLLEQMNSSRVFVFESTEYDAGFMNSSAITEVRMNEDEDMGVLFTLHHKINHSPVSMVPESARFGAANIVTTLAVDKIEDSELRAFVESFDKDKPFVMTTDVAMNGTTNSELKVSAAEHRDGDTTITTTAATINFLTSETGDVSGDGVLPKMMINDNSSERGEISNLTLDFDMDKLGKETGVSKFFYNLILQVKIEEAKIIDNNTDEPLMLANDIHYTADQKLDDKNPYAKFKMGIGSIAADEIPLRSMNMESAITGFSVEALIANSEFFAGLQTSDEPEQLLFTGKGLEILQASFPPDTKLSIDGNAETTDGDIDAKINLWFTGNGSKNGYAGMQTTGDLAKAFAGTVNIVADKSALMSSPLGEMLGHPFALIYLKITDDSVSLSANLDKLELDVNGQVMPLELMAGEILQMPLEALLAM